MGCGLLLSGPIWADSAPADAIEPRWRIRLDQPLLWHTVAPHGPLLVATSTHLRGIDEHSGRSLWAQELPEAVLAGAIVHVPGTFLAMLSDDRPPRRLVTLDVRTGRRIIDSRINGPGKLVGHQLLPISGRLLLIGRAGGDHAVTLALFDPGDARPLWSSDRILADPDDSAAALLSLLRAVRGSERQTLRACELDDGTFLLAGAGGLHRIDIASGTARWRAVWPFGAEALHCRTTPYSPGVVYVSARQKMRGGSVWSAWNIDDGEPLWDDPQILHGEIDDALLFEKGILVPSQQRKDRLSLVDYATGRRMWQDELQPLRASRVRGQPLDHQFVDGGLLYVTTREMRLIDPETGRAVARPAVISDRGLLTAGDGASLWFFSLRHETLYRIDRRDGEIRRLSRAALRSYDADAPQSLEVAEHGLMLQSGGDLVAFDFEGRIRYHRKFAVRARSHPSGAVTTKPFTFLTIKRERGAFGLLRVDQRTGRAAQWIDLAGDGTPDYRVDDSGTRVYYRFDAHSIAGYELPTDLDLAYRDPSR